MKELSLTLLPQFQRTRTPGQDAHSDRIVAFPHHNESFVDDKYCKPIVDGSALAHFIHLDNSHLALAAVKHGLHCLIVAAFEMYASRPSTHQGLWNGDISGRFL
jgi:hypothetical protein